MQNHIYAIYISNIIYNFIELYFIFINLYTIHKAQVTYFILSLCTITIIKLIHCVHLKNDSIVHLVLPDLTFLDVDWGIIVPDLKRKKHVFLIKQLQQQNVLTLIYSKYSNILLTLTQSLPFCSC